MLDFESRYIEPEPNISQSVLMSGIFFLIASTMLRVGLVRPLKMLLSDAGDISMNCANTCWVICCDSIIWRILSFILLK